MVPRNVVRSQRSTLGFCQTQIQEISGDRSHATVDAGLWIKGIMKDFALLRTRDRKTIPLREIIQTCDLAYYYADGSLIFVGRKDTQVKLQGQRIEFGEVESCRSCEKSKSRGFLAIPERTGKRTREHRNYTASWPSIHLLTNCNDNDSEVLYFCRFHTCTFLGKKRLHVSASASSHP
ncbi:hypothetical protein BELL_0009g00480 [Botrytis elliptica]|uniref:Uncharacterized protein n=1 Tax=Botrytis elliptica TaxID=278938 RepID=A0A4Z1K8E9_9HELO|nr:hypothetical protein BELL_0009g00480 [Botrytis elliptica]